MSWRLKKKAHALVAGEEGVVCKEWGGRVSLALVYPNTYAVGMSNLGFQTIYEHLNRLPRVVCERVFFRRRRFGWNVLFMLGSPLARRTSVVY